MFSLTDDSVKRSNILDIKINNYTECGFCADKDREETLKIPWSIWSEWMYISQHMGEKEWGAVFWVKNNTIRSFKIPKQEVGSTECEFKEELGGDGIIHSHHDMGAFHSSQDDAHARNLYTYSIVIANSKGSIATKRIKLPCNSFGYVKVRLEIIEAPCIDFAKIGQTGIEKRQELEDEYDPCEICQTGDCENCEYLSVPFLACENCDILKCKSCKMTSGMDIRGILPFCEYCVGSADCVSCDKLKKYLDNYPQEKARLESSDKTKR